VAPPGNQAETEKTNVGLEQWEKAAYSTTERLRVAHTKETGAAGKTGGTGESLG